MTSATTPEERESLREQIRKARRAGYTYATADSGPLDRLLDERDAMAEELRALRAETERLRSKGEIISARYAISHAPKGQNGGPWESRTGPIGTPTRNKLRMLATANYPKFTLFDVQRRIQHARIVAFVTRRKAKK